jgi:predicted metalloprotease
MRWDQDHESPDVIDRRGERSGGNLAGLLPFLPLLFRSRFGWLILLVAGGYYAYRYFGGGSAQSAHGARTDVSGEGRAETEEVHFVSFVLDDTQATWSREFAARGAGTYRHAKLVLFTNATQTGCGFGRAATGPFYCPSDERVYIDLGFFNQLAHRLGARGQFAQAYVVAHEIGHHVQKLLGTSERVSRLHGNTEGATGASVRLELQADCLAGMWAHSTAQRNLLEGSDLDEALGATAAIGDDRLQREATGTVRPETWTHGSSAQRGKWFRRGYEAGKMEACDTFAAGAL